MTQYFSTHILTRRMTLFAYPNTSLLTFSTHILTRRMTICDATNPTSAMIFNSHPHKEDDTLSIQTYSLYQFFNSHPHKEDDHHIPTCTATITFSTHILTRRMTCRTIRRSTHCIFQLTSSQGG